MAVFYTALVRIVEQHWHSLGYFMFSPKMWTRRPRALVYQGLSSLISCLILSHQHWFPEAQGKELLVFGLGGGAD